MDNLGKAVLMAGFAFMFTLAASISIYLYSTLDRYLDQATASTSIVNRAEGISSEDLRNFEREITIAEIYITLFNMEQMHIDELTVVLGSYNKTITRVEAEDGAADFATELKELENNKFRYYYENNSVKYIATDIEE